MSLITKKQAGLILNRPERTILDWIENGVLKAHRVKSVLYVDSDTVYALKDTEADIDHALQERKTILQELDANLAEMRRVNHFNREEIRRTIKCMVNALGIPSMNEREKMVLSEVMEGKKYDDVGEVLGLSRERVRQLFEKALRKIRNCSVVYGKVYDEVLTLRGENQNLRKVIERQEAMLRDYREKLHIEEMPQEQMTAELYGKRLVDCDLSVRTLNCLKGADIETVGDLVQYNKTDLLRLRNFGKKSLTELDDFLVSIGQEFGQKNITPVYPK